MAFPSRWGWHSCDYATFLLLKKLHAAYWRALPQFATWQRWHRKQPQNRVLRRRIRDGQGYKIGVEVVGPWPEPTLSPVFCTRRQVLTHWDENGKPLKEGRFREEVVFDDHGIPEKYRTARRPAASEEQVQPLGITQEELQILLRRIEEAD
jgi:hypothetical protein